MKVIMSALHGTIHRMLHCQTCHLSETSALRLNEESQKLWGWLTVHTVVIFWKIVHGGMWGFKGLHVTRATLLMLACVRSCSMP